MSNNVYFMSFFYPQLIFHKFFQIKLYFSHLHTVVMVYDYTYLHTRDKTLELVGEHGGKGWLVGHADVWHHVDGQPVVLLEIVEAV